MFAAKILLNRCSYIRVALRKCSTNHYNKEFTVTSFCNLNINLPYNTTIKPLDLFKYQNCDKVIVRCNEQIESNQFEDTINITATNINDTKNVHCEIEAPVKANLNISCMKDINVSNFYGDTINLYSETGNIIIKKCQSNHISVQTNIGNINAEGVIQAAYILMKTKNKGYIKTGRLQGLKLNVETVDGDVTTDSSYCDDSTFCTKNGKLKLQNNHKHNNIIITNEGHLKMTGCDGSLNISMEKGFADVQVSRIENDSKIYINEVGSLILRLAEGSQENTCIKIVAKNVMVDENVNLIKEKSGNDVLLIPQDPDTEWGNIVVDCKNSDVKIQTSSWSEMFVSSFQENIEKS